MGRSAASFDDDIDCRGSFLTPGLSLWERMKMYRSTALWKNRLQPSIALSTSSAAASLRARAPAGKPLPTPVPHVRPDERHPQPLLPLTNPLPPNPSSAKVFRCQLPRQNPFYAYNPTAGQAPVWRHDEAVAAGRSQGEASLYASYLDGILFSIGHGDSAMRLEN